MDTTQLQQLPSQENQSSKTNKLTVAHGTINLVKALIGLGVLALPYGFQKCGWLGGLLLLLICGIMVIYSSLLIIWSAEKRNSKAKSFIQFSTENLEQKQIIWVEIFLIGGQIGTCVAYVIYFSSYFEESLCFFTGNDSSHYLCSSKLPSILTSFIIVLPSIFIKQISKLKDVCLIANVLALFCLGVIFIAFLIKLDSSVINSSQIETLKWENAGEVIGIFLFALSGISLYFEIRQNSGLRILLIYYYNRSQMIEPTKFTTVMNISTQGVMIIYSLIGLFGYLAFGSKVKEVILFNFSMTNPLFVFVQILYCIAILLSYPLNIFPVVQYLENKLIQNLKVKNSYQPINQKDEKEVQILENDLNKNQKIENKEIENLDTQNDQGQKEEGNNTQKTEKEISNNNNQGVMNENNNPTLSQSESLDIDLNDINELDENQKNTFEFQSMYLRISCLLIIFAISIIFQKLSLFLSFMGSVGGVLFNFILPVVFYEKSMPEASKSIIYFNRIIMVFGIILSIFAIIQTIKEIIY